MKKLVLVAFAVLLALSGCGAEYDKEDFIGKTSVQIEEEFGKFDCILSGPADEDGAYRNQSCGYTIKEQKKGFLGTEPEKLVFIRFDENGIAYDTYEGIRPGG